jgi:hypothetical protein
MLAGLGQLCLAMGSLAIPRLLRWPQELAGLRPLTREMFWVYALYIWCSHLAFALLSMLASDALIDGSLLAGCVTGFIAAWWGVRLTLQFTCLDRRSAPPGAIYRCGEVALVLCFVFFTVVYGFAAALNFGGSI